MKTLLKIAAVLALTITTATAQIHLTQNLFDTSLATAVSAAAAKGITNDYPGISFTNLSGTAMITTNNVATNSGMANVDFLLDGNLWSLRDGSPAFDRWYTGDTNTVTMAAAELGHANISATIAGAGANLNGVVTFRFVPLADGVNLSTTAADQFVFSITGNGVTPVTVITNVPLSRWIGCKKVRLVSIENGDADTAAWVRSVTLNGFVP